MKRTGQVAVAAVVLLGFSASASATVMAELPLAEMVQGADSVVHGTVIRTGVRMHAGPDGLNPETLTLIRVHEWLGGGEGETVTIRELGGAWQGGGLRYDGTPEYSVGEEVIVFLSRRPEAPHDLRTMGMVQGKFVVQHGAPGVPTTVSRDLHGVSFIGWAEGRQEIREPGDQPTMELTRFLEYIRQTRGNGSGR